MDTSENNDDLGNNFLGDNEQYLLADVADEGDDGEFKPAISDLNNSLTSILYLILWLFIRRSRRRRPLRSNWSTSGARPLPSNCKCRSSYEEKHSSVRKGIYSNTKI